MMEYNHRLGQTARKSLVFQAPDKGDTPPPKKRAKRSKKGKKKAGATKKKPLQKPPSLLKTSTAPDLDSVFLQWKRKVPALRGMSASEHVLLKRRQS